MCGGGGGDFLRSGEGEGERVVGAALVRARRRAVTVKWKGRAAKQEGGASLPLAAARLLPVGKAGPNDTALASLPNR